MNSPKTWHGAIVIAYRINPLEVLTIENPHRNKTALLSGAVEDGDGGSQAKAAVRELREEVGWQVDEDALEPTDIFHEFVYQPDKPGRGGDNGSNRVFLLDAAGLPDPQAIDPDVRNPLWFTPEEAKTRVSFPDLKIILSEAVDLIKANLSPANY